MPDQTDATPAVAEEEIAPEETTELPEADLDTVSGGMQPPQHE